MKAFQMIKKQGRKHSEQTRLQPTTLSKSTRHSVTVLPPGEITAAAGCHRAHRSDKVTQAEPFKGIHLEAQSACAAVSPLRRVINGALGREDKGSTRLSPHPQGQLRAGWGETLAVSKPKGSFLVLISDC